MLYHFLLSTCLYLKLFYINFVEQDQNGLCFSNITILKQSNWDDARSI